MDPLLNKKVQRLTRKILSRTTTEHLYQGFLSTVQIISKSQEVVKQKPDGILYHIAPRFFPEARKKSEHFQELPCHLHKQSKLMPSPRHQLKLHYYPTCRVLPKNLPVGLAIIRSVTTFIGYPFPTCQYQKHGPITCQI